MEESNILVQDLCKQFDGFLLDCVSFQVLKGKIVGFIWENGAGFSAMTNSILSYALMAGVAALALFMISMVISMIGYAKKK